MDDPSVFGDGTTNNQLIQKPANQAQQPPEQKYQNVQPVQQPNGKILSKVAMGHWVLLCVCEVL